MLRRGCCRCAWPAARQSAIPHSAAASADFPNIGRSARIRAAANPHSLHSPYGPGLPGFVLGCTVTSRGRLCAMPARRADAPVQCRRGGDGSVVAVRSPVPVRAAPGARRRRVGARQPAEPLLRPRDRRRSVRGGHRRVPAVRRHGHERAGDRAPCRHQFAARRQPDAGRHPGAADEEGAHPVARHAGLAAPGPGARRRGIRHRRRHLARPARYRLCQIGRHRDAVGQRQPGAQRGALLGGDRPDHQGAVVA